MQSHKNRERMIQPSRLTGAARRDWISYLTHDRNPGIQPIDASTAY